MEKDFDTWNLFKKELDVSKNKLFREKEIWWCSVGVNVGSEQHSLTADFSRPVLVFKKWSSNTFWGIPLTTKIKDLEFRYEFYIGEIHNQALITQMRCFDSKRLIRRLETMDDVLFREIQELLVGYIIKTEPALESAGSSGAEATVCIDSILTVHSVNKQLTSVSPLKKGIV
jgi:mRNA interferase MazF